MKIEKQMVKMYLIQSQFISTKSDIHYLPPMYVICILLNGNTFDLNFRENSAQKIPCSVKFDVSSKGKCKTLLQGIFNLKEVVRALKCSVCILIPLKSVRKFAICYVN